MRTIPFVFEITNTLPLFAKQNLGGAYLRQSSILWLLNFYLFDSPHTNKKLNQLVNTSAVGIYNVCSCKSNSWAFWISISQNFMVTDINECMTTKTVMNGEEE